MDYLSLEKIRIENRKKVCIFGAGKIGRTWAYDILTCAGFTIDCYCDNKMPVGGEVVNGVKSVAFGLLCEKPDEYLTFIAVNENLQDEIADQLEANGITDYVRMGFLFLQDICESVFASQDAEVWERYKIIADDREFLKRQFKYSLGYELDLKEPQTFNAKLQWLKLYDRNPAYIQMVDKYEFKKYIAKVLGEEYVIPTLGVWDSVDEIEWDKLPNQFVIKCTHDSGSVIVCKDKRIFDVENAKKKLARALRYNYFWSCREWPYKNVKPRIMSEAYMGEDGELRDYKFLTFAGKAELLYVASDRMNKMTETKFDYFDRNYKTLGIRQEHPNSEVTPLKPSKFDFMIKIVEKLAQDVKHVRVDLYETEGNVYVGEMTFYHLAGLVKFDPEEWDYKLGELLDLLN